MKVLDDAFSKVVNEIKKILNEVNYDEFKTNVFENIYQKFLEYVNIKLIENFNLNFYM